MPEKGSVFLLGSGFIGLEILKELIAEEYKVTTLVRREDAQKRLETMGSKTIHGSLDDADLIRDATASHDIIIHAATADHEPSAMSILDGIAKSDKRGQIYIHTSGCSALVEADDDGSKVSDKIYSDDNPEMIDAIPESAPHRVIDLAILERRKQLAAKAKISIVLPPLIYGVNHAGLLSIQIPTLARFAIKNGYPGYVGGGKALWSQIHVSDLARGYMTILHHLESTSPSNPYFFIENGDECSWSECAAEIGKALKAEGKVKDEKPRQIPRNMYSFVFGDFAEPVLGRNSRCRAVRLRQLGWSPKEKGTLESLRLDEMNVLLAEDLEGWEGYGAAVAS
ncbi:NAD(P)-binding Rossmann-fold containing protein [Glarea lozoyensis ATCC 20868]|uniref:NAD(P)-binding Rossmann-fold containing protein n=1 Tax=Glarea lozoyensis (strain ATCC 20868 / MF5171) TaxID=1116229 RepID=S3CW99_GLAL2|nr:NAD(P)-binding Rossmann-fold containing protein [Glarea lozoyensis ATCC 20868]EPE24091.1 NAD(P)-binding Rossmann-fold containing protein [Glarea lozoyensis ATCC 20868]